MMTISTVGYGDVSMKTPSERMLAIVAMIFGGSFYAYLVGSITALVSDADLNSRACRERMNLVTAWLDFHDELPAVLRRRIWRHFKEHLAKKTAVEDSIVMNDLPSNLRQTLAGFLLPNDVRYNPLFDSLPSHEFPALVMIVQYTSRVAEEVVCFRGERGHAMFILTKGTAKRTEEGETSTVLAGDSFGEEIILGICLEYVYTVTAESKCSLLQIPADSFSERFAARPDLIESMRRSFDKIRRVAAPRSGHAGSSSVLEGGSTGLSPSFPDAVFTFLHELMSKVDAVNAAHKQEREILSNILPQANAFARSSLDEVISFQAMNSIK
jgi:CRP-like cAMP-binding protein